MSLYEIKVGSSSKSVDFFFYGEHLKTFYSENFLSLKFKFLIKFLIKINFNLINLIDFNLKNFVCKNSIKNFHKFFFLTI